MNPDTMYYTLGTYAEPKISNICEQTLMGLVLFLETGNQEAVFLRLQVLHLHIAVAMSSM